MAELESPETYGSVAGGSNGAPSSSIGGRFRRDVAAVLLTAAMLSGVYFSSETFFSDLLGLRRSSISNNQFAWNRECVAKSLRNGTLAGGDAVQPIVGFPGDFVEVFSKAPRIYILCVECDTVVVPRAWENNHALLDGKAFDECQGTLDLVHGLRVSQMHAAVLADALERNFEFVAIMEEDIRPDFNVKWGPEAIGELMDALKTRPWSTVRFGFRPFFIERSNRASDAKPLLNPPVPAGSCPDARCVCQQLAGVACQMAATGCDMRSSDAYFIHARYFDFLSKRLLDYDRATIVPEQYGKHIIDLDGFAALPNQILAVPQWTYQKGGSVDGTNLGMQKADSETFIKQCVTTM